MVTLTYLRRNRVQAELAEGFGVSQSMISRAITALVPILGRVLVVSLWVVFFRSTVAQTSVIDAYGADEPPRQDDDVRTEFVDSGVNSGVESGMVNS